MKKITALLLAIFMILSCLAFASCEKENGTDLDKDDNEKTEAKDTELNETEPQKTEEIKVGDGIDKLNGKTVDEIYERAMNTLKTVDNCTIMSYQDITMTAQGSQKQTMQQTMISALDGHNMYVKVTNDMVASVNMEVWYVADIYYLSSSELQCKAAIPYDEFVEKYCPGGTDAASSLIAFPAEWFTDVKFIYESQDRYYIRIEASGAELVEYMGEAGVGNGVDMSASENIVYSVYFDEDGELIEIKTEFGMVIEGVQADYIVTSIISEVGTTTITPPQNTDTWQDLTGRI